MKKSDVEAMVFEANHRAAVAASEYEARIARLKDRIAELEKENELLLSPPPEGSTLCPREKKVKTRAATKKLIAQGQIQKQNCVICGDPDTEIHHPNYDNPNQVVWLCKRHHWEHHLYDCIRNGKDGRIFANYLRKYYKKPPFDYYD